MRPDLTEVLRKPIPVWELRLFECDDGGYQCHPQRLSMKARWPRKRSRENERGLHLRRPYSFLKVSAVNRNR
jgi:hypothetical protein